MSGRNGADRQLQALVHGISHDLRAPLRAIDGFAGKLARDLDGRLQPAEQDLLDRIRAATVRMGGLIDSLVDLARIEHAVLRPQQVDLSLLAEWCAAELQDAQPQRPARIVVQPGLQVIGDERQLKLLLTQLLRNAWRFSASRPQVEIEVDGEQRPDGVTLSVRDHGNGFDMAYADKLFEPFQRLHGADEGAGDGLGLAIARLVAQRHGGDIEADAEVGAGACFRVRLANLPEHATELRHPHRPENPPA